VNTAALLATGCVLREQEPLASYTTFQLGGPCPLLLDCATPAQLTAAVIELHRAGRDFALIGGGSNLLVADAGVPVPVIRYFTAQPLIQQTGTVLEVSGSTLLDDLCAYAAQNGLAGLEALNCIPGTLGGAIVGNAGAFGKQIGDVVESVTLLARDGHAREADRAELRFVYRSSALHNSNDIALAARLRLQPGDAAQLQYQRAECTYVRTVKHPDYRNTPTAGCFFRNVVPTSVAGRRQAAGWFLEHAGAPAMRINGARPYEKHANIIIRDGPCKAQDVLELSRQMAAAVATKFGVQLEREVRLLGTFA
jgi:UDP-N-acetylmuramate dehydrogenase